MHCPCQAGSQLRKQNHSLPGQSSMQYGGHLCSRRHGSPDAWKRLLSRARPSSVRWRAAAWPCGSCSPGSFMSRLMFTTCGQQTSHLPSIRICSCMVRCADRSSMPTHTDLEGWQPAQGGFHACPGAEQGVHSCCRDSHFQGLQVRALSNAVGQQPACFKHTKWNGKLAQAPEECAGWEVLHFAACKSRGGRV